MKSQIIPAIITSDGDELNDFDELKNKFEKLKPFLGAFNNCIQIDITDGKFVSTETIISLKDLRYFTLRSDIELHLMILRPEETIGEWWARIGAKKIIVHIEAIEDMSRLLNVCRENNIGVGLALNPETPNLMIAPWVNAVDFVVFLGVRPGHGGQKFIPEVLEKIKSLRQNFPDVKIEIDGGVTVDNIQKLKNAGADIFVVGSGILNAPDIGKAIGAFEEKLRF